MMERGYAGERRRRVRLPLTEPWGASKEESQVSWAAACFGVYMCVCVAEGMNG
jgi:hypothetical protein